jgi:lanthanide-dependent methanol dehydrogenase
LAAGLTADGSMMRPAWIGILLLLAPCVLRAQETGASAAADPGFSDLDEITATNVARLAPAFTFRTGSPGAHAATPLVAGSTLLLLTPFPHSLFALDLTRPDAPVKWRYTAAADRLAAGLTCCGAAEGGIAVVGDRVFLDTLDGHAIAIDLASGRAIWDATVARPEEGEVLSAAPLPVKDEIIVGSAGDDSGARGWVAALDVATGRQRWKVYSAGPDSDVGIGDGFHPVSGAPRQPDLGVSTWPPSAWQHAGGGLSGEPVYDPESNLVFYQTGHPAPWNPDQRRGENRWTSGLFARDPTTGAARWFDPVNPHDLYALGATGGLLLAPDAARPQRRLLIHPDANGYLYVLDRATGEIVSANPFLPVTATRGVETGSGALLRDARFATQANSTVRDICPAWPAGSTAAPAFSPRTSLLFLPVSRLCMDMEARDTSYIAGTLFAGADVRLKPWPGQSAGALIGWDLAAGHAIWTVAEPFPLRSGALATAGGLVFYGTLDGVFKAVDAHSGKVLWRYALSSGVVGRPATYRGPDEHQYVAVVAGAGALSGGSATEIDPRDATAARGLAAVLQRLPPPADRSGKLYVFRLP